MRNVLFANISEMIIVAYSYADACRNIFNTIRSSGHSSLEKYTSHFYWKGCVWEGVGDRTELQYIDPSSSVYHSLSFPFSWAAQLGAWGPSLSWDVVLIPASSLQLTWTSCYRGYIIIWRLPTSCERHNFALNSTPRQSRLPLISWYLRLDARVIYIGAFLFLTAWPGRRSICNIIIYTFRLLPSSLLHVLLVELGIFNENLKQILNVL